MSQQPRDYETIQRKIDQKIAQQRWLYRWIFFGTHVVFYLITMLAVWGTVASDAHLRDALFGDGAGAGIVVILPSILWAVLILGHVALLFTESSVSERTLRERFLMVEVGEELLRKGLKDESLWEKPKRSASSTLGHTQLSDDGELIPADDDETLEQDDSPARRHQAGES